MYRSYAGWHGENAGQGMGYIWLLRGFRFFSGSWQDVGGRAATASSGSRAVGHARRLDTARTQLWGFRFVGKL